MSSEFCRPRCAAGAEGLARRCLRARNASWPFTAPSLCPGHACDAAAPSAASPLIFASADRTIGATESAVMDRVAQ